MTKYEVLLSETATRQLTDLSADMQERIRESLFRLRDEPFRRRPKADIKRLKGPNRSYYRLRVGEFRVIYVVEGTTVKVAKILPRSSAYKWLE